MTDTATPALEEYRAELSRLLTETAQLRAEAGRLRDACRFIADGMCTSDRREGCDPDSEDGLCEVCTARHALAGSSTTLTDDARLDEMRAQVKALTTTLIGTTALLITLDDRTECEGHIASELLPGQCFEAYPDGPTEWCTSCSVHVGLAALALTETAA